MRVKLPWTRPGWVIADKYGLARKERKYQPIIRLRRSAALAECGEGERPRKVKVTVEYVSGPPTTCPACAAKDREIARLREECARQAKYWAKQAQDVEDDMYVQRLWDAAEGR